MKNRRLGILTYHHVINEGAVLQAYAQAKALKIVFPDDQVEIVDYRAKSREQQEIFGIVRGLKKGIREGATRYRRYRKIKKFVSAALPLSKDKAVTDDYGTAVEFINGKSYDAMFVGSDEVWKVTSDGARNFPNIYWLGEQLEMRKFALAASGNKTDPQNLTKTTNEMMKAMLSGFDLIGVRDDHTWDMVIRQGVSRGLIHKVPDPTWSLEMGENDGLGVRLERQGIDLRRPIAVMLFSSESRVMGRISEISYKILKELDYQVASLSSYNRYVDYDLRGLFDPLEWAHVFRLLSFCLTDRFHGTIFALKNRVPFLTLDHQKHYITNKSKTKDLLEVFELNDRLVDLNMRYTQENFDEIMRRGLLIYDIESICEKEKICRDAYWSFLYKVKNVLDKAQIP